MHNILIFHHSPIVLLGGEAGVSDLPAVLTPDPYADW